MYNISAEVGEFCVNRVFNPLSHLHGWITQKDGLCCRGDHDDEEEDDDDDDDDDEEEEEEEEEEVMLEMEMTKMMMRAMVVIMVVTITMPRLVLMMTVRMCF